MCKRKLAYLAVFQSHSITAVNMGTNPIHTDQLARHKKAGYLISSILAGDCCLKEARTDGKQRGKRLAGTEQVFTFFQTAALTNNRI